MTTLTEPATETDAALNRAARIIAAAVLHHEPIPAAAVADFRVATDRLECANWARSWGPSELES